MATKQLSQKEVAKYLLRLRDASESFEGFVRLIYPDWKIPEFQLELIRTLDALEQDKLDCDNLLITMPPRHAKSTFSTVLFPSYFMARNPNRYIMSCSYNAELAKDFGRQIRSVVEQPSIVQAFPDFKLSQESRAADTWRTESGGAYFAVGVGGTTSGRPANLLIVDDPIKSREDAESMTQRNKTWNYYASALSTRLQPQSDGSSPKQLIILTRWHPDDLAGRLMATDDWKEGRWKHINFKAINKRKLKSKVERSALPTDHPDYKTVDELKRAPTQYRYVNAEEEYSLWPERFSLEDLKRRERLNPREFAALYQQQPYIQGGNIIKSSWWNHYPSDLKPENFPSLIITVDTAFKKTEQADYSVACVAGIDRNGDIYIVDVIRGKYDFPELKQRLIRLNNQWRGRGLRAIYIEDKASGQSLLQELKRESGMAVIPYKVVNDKVARVNAVLPIIEGGRVFIPEESSWLDDFIDECVSFPNGIHDDQVDAVAMAIDILSRTAISPEQAALNANPMDSLNNQQRDYGKSLFKSLTGQARNWKGWGA